jgi:hypothetical protein
MSDMAWFSIGQLFADLGVLAMSIGSVINLRRLNRIERELKRLRELVNGK